MLASLVRVVHDCFAFLGLCERLRGDSFVTHRDNDGVRQVFKVYGSVYQPRLGEWSLIGTSQFIYVFGATWSRRQCLWRVEIVMSVICDGALLAEMNNDLTRLWVWPDLCRDLWTACNIVWAFHPCGASIL